MQIQDLKITGRSSMSILGKNKNGLLFEVDREKSFVNNPINVIYINGSQLDHYDAKGNTIFNPCAGSTNFGHVGDWYNKAIKPYVFKYIVSKDTDDCDVFCKSLESLLAQLGTDQNVIVGKSYGGILAALAARSSLVKACYAVNPSICGSALSDLDLLKQYRKNLIDWLIYFECAHILEPGRTFTKENALGVDVEYSNKVHIFGGSINNLTPHNPMELLMMIAAQKNLQIYGKLSDGLAVWDLDYYKSKGFDVTVMERPYHHLSQNSSYMAKVFSKIKKEI